MKKIQLAQNLIMQTNKLDNKIILYLLHTNEIIFI